MSFGIQEGGSFLRRGGTSYIQGQAGNRGSSAISQANDVQFGGIIGDGDIIMYASPSGKWGNVPLTLANHSDVHGGVTTGATNGSVFQFNGTNWNSGVVILSGAGSPESSVTANPGALYLNTNGGANSTLWVKESGAGNTGWVAK